MGNICWDFPLLGTGSESGSNIAAITMFKGAGVMDGLAREGCQNSLDAKNKELDDSIPVKVKFELYRINKNDYSMFEGYEAAVKSSCEYWENSTLRTDELLNFLKSVNDAISCENIPILVMSDYNTTGLRGVKSKETETSYWDLLVNTEGISIKEDKSSAGSYGIGKNAPFAYSALNLVFYNTLAVDGGRAFQGVTRLVTTMREHDGVKRKAAPIGKYLFLEDMFTGRPILPEDNCKLAQFDAFKREENEIGTDVAVFGFKEQDYPEWEQLITIAIIKNFPLAIHDNKLEAVIKSEHIEYKICKDTLEKLLFDTFKDAQELKYTRQIYRTVTDYDDVKTVSIVEPDDLTLYVKYSKTYSQSLSRFRSTGMLINTTGEGLPHYSVVVVVNDVCNCELSTTLRKAEPPQHTEWKASNITDNTDLRNRARKYINAINRAVQALLDECDPVEPTEIIDGGVGSFLPDNDNKLPNGDENDGLMIDIDIERIQTRTGKVLYNNYKTAEGATGSKETGDSHKTGDKKNKKKTKKKIERVKPETGKKDGVSPGQGKVVVVDVNMDDYRIPYLGGNRYRLYAKCPKDYNNLYVRYYAARDDMSVDNSALKVKKVKVNDDKTVVVNKDIIGPISFTEGGNYVYIEFENHELMGVTPVFTVEVKNEN